MFSTGVSKDDDCKKVPDAEEFEFVRSFKQVGIEGSSPAPGLGSFSPAKLTFSMWWFEIDVYFHPYLGKVSNLTHIFQMGWFNHQLVLEPPRKSRFAWMSQEVFRSKF